MMTIGDSFRVTLFGSSHGPHVGASITGVPKGIVIDNELIQLAMDERRPGGKFSSKRTEPDVVEWQNGVKDGITDGGEIRCIIQNLDVRSSDYSFLPHHPRPGHQDMVMHIKSKGTADLRGGGTSSARLTAPLVAAAALISPLLNEIGVSVQAHVGAVGSVKANLITDCPPKWKDELCHQLRCRDPNASVKIAELIEEARKNRDSLGSMVSAVISGLPIGVGEPWFDGLEPALGRGLLAIPAARGVEFGHGFAAVQMLGSSHNSPWAGTKEHPVQIGEQPDGGLAGVSTGSDLHLNVAFKPPSSIPRPQSTLNLETGEQEELIVKGRHDPVLAPRATAVVEAVCKIVIFDLCIRGNFFG